MGCGCNKKIGNGQAMGARSARTAVYQVVDKGGSVVSEHTTAGDARKAAVEAGGRIRVTSKSTSGAVS